MTQPATQDAIAAICKSIQEALKDPSIIHTVGRQTENFEALAIGIPSIDRALCGGLPKGRITELYGPEAAGKTTVMLHAIAAAQKRGELVYFVDAENSLDVLYAQRIGVIPERLLLSQPDYGEQALDVMKVICEKIVDYQEQTGVYINSLVVLDSIPALVPRQEFEKMEEKGTSDVVSSMGSKARMFSDYLPRILTPAAKARATLVFINQERDNIGVMYGPKTTTPGGRAMKYYASVRMQVRKTGKYEVNGEQVGIRSVLTPVKSKLYSIFGAERSAEFVITANGIDLVADVLFKAIEKNIISKSGAHFKFQDKSWHGYAKLEEEVRKTPELYSKIASATAQQ